MSQQKDQQINSKQYEKVKKDKKQEQITENEIRITSSGKTRSYITYAVQAFQEKKHDSVVLKAMGRAINKAVTICEIIKRRVADLHQITEVGSHHIVEEWEPKEQGLSKKETTRNVSSITITLTLKTPDTKNIGYQKPIPKDQVVEEEKKETKEFKKEEKKEKKEFTKKDNKKDETRDSESKRGTRGGRGRGRGGRGGRGRGTRGRGRGGNRSESQE